MYSKTIRMKEKLLENLTQSFSEIITISLQIYEKNKYGTI